MPGTQVPGVIIAGTYSQDGKRLFWDVSNRDRAISIKLDAGLSDVLTYNEERFDELIVEVSDPDAAVHAIEQAIAK
jgi:hypothetical protein